MKLLHRVVTPFPGMQFSVCSEAHQTTLALCVSVHSHISLCTPLCGNKGDKGDQKSQTCGGGGVGGGGIDGFI